MSDDGREFVQYLQSELHETFSKILLSSKDERDELVGYGRCLSDLIKDFHKSVDKKINTSIFDI